MTEKIKRWEKWTFWPALILTLVCIAMLIVGASELAWKWFLPFYLLIGAPNIVGAFVDDFGRLRSSYRTLRGRPDEEL